MFRILQDYLLVERVRILIREVDTFTMFFGITTSSNDKCGFIRESAYANMCDAVRNSDGSEFAAI